MKWKLIRLPNNRRPRSIYQGSDCKIYVSGYETFGIIEDSYISIADDVLKDSNQEYWNIFGDSSKIVFQSFSEVFQYDYKDTKKLNTPGNVMFGDYVDNELLLPKVESGIYKIEGHEISEEKTNKPLPNGSKVVGMVTGGIFATQNHGLFLKEENGYTAINSVLNDQLQQDQINNLMRMKSGSFVIGTILNGIYITSDLQHIDYHINKSNGLSNNTVLSLFEDNQGNIWCGLDKGIDLIKLGSKLTYFYDKRGQLGSVFTSVIYKDELYLGTNQGLFKQNRDGEFAIVEGSQGQVWSLITIDDELICGHNKGTFLIEGDVFLPISEITGGWCMKALDEVRFIQSSYTGLVLFKKIDGVWNSGQRIENGGVLIENFEIIDHFFVGYHPHQGISKMEFTQGFDTVARMEVLENIKVENPLFIAEENGILIRDKTYDSFIKKPGFTGEIPKDYKFSRDEKAVFTYALAIVNIEKTDQISNPRFNRPQRLQEFYVIGFNEGYIKIPSDYKNEKVASIELDYMMVNDAAILFESKENIDLKSNENDIVFQFKSKFSESENMNFKYQLKGWDDDWFDLPANGFLKFNNLQNGNYTLMTSDGMNVASFEIAPKWYESWIGFLIYILLGLLIIYFFNKRQQVKLRNQRIRLEEEKKRELDSERIKAKNTELENDVVYKNKMLANSTMTLVQKNKMLIDLKSTLSRELKSTTAEKRRQILHLIEMNINNDDDWELFEHTFAEVHEDFLDKLREAHPTMTNGELRLSAYIKMDLSSKEIAPLMNISTRSIENKRYRLRKKLGVEDVSLKGYLQGF